MGTRQGNPGAVVLLRKDRGTQKLFSKYGMNE